MWIHLYTFYLRVYSVGHMVKDHSDSKRGNLLLPLHGLLFLISSKESFHMHHLTDRIPHTMAFFSPIVEHWLEREMARWVHHQRSIRWPIAPRADTLPMSYRAMLNLRIYTLMMIPHFIGVVVVVAIIILIIIVIKKTQTKITCKWMGFGDFFPLNSFHSYLFFIGVYYKCHFKNHI